ncbi:MAG: hypothetical protein ACMXYF_01145 [Candidatus Woesearchaeota archaeon]
MTKSKKDTYSYKGWLNSDYFLKRAFAVYGYSVVAGLLISIPIFLLFFIFALFFAFVGAALY